MNKLLTLLLSVSSILGVAQYGDCDNSVDACSNPAFSVTPSQFGNVEEFTINSTVSNPQNNPNGTPGNMGCLMSGELNSTWLTVNVTTAGTLEFSMGTAGSFNCFDWIMWPYDGTACSDIANNTLPPVACNWNGACTGITGMANPANLPAGADQTDFEYELNVNAGDQFVICFSNFSSATTNVPLDFFGTATVTCGNVTNPTICFGETAEITAFDGTTYNWDTSIPGFINTNAAGDIAYVNPTVTTDYTVDIVLANGNIVQETSTVTVNPQITITATPTLETCIGDGDGQLQFNLTNAVAPVTYTLSGTATGTNSSGLFTNLTSGNYTIDVVDGNGCSNQFTTTLDPGPVCCGMTLTTNGTNNPCFGNCLGTASVDTVGTTGACTIQWFDPTGNPLAGANSLNIANLCAGTYSVEVVDPACTLTETFTVTEPLELTIGSTITDVDCFGNNTGTIEMTVNGGSPTYQYSIDSGISFQNTNQFPNLSAGVYELATIDINGCQKTATATITEPSELTASANVINNNCNQNNTTCDGSIEIVPNGGSAPYSYSWNNGLLGIPNQTDICANNYEVTVTDALGCVFLLNNLVVTEPDEVTIDLINSTDPLCYEDCDGTIEIIATNANSYSIDGGINTGVSNNYQDLCTGEYDILVADANGCPAGITVSLSSPGGVIANFSFSPENANIQNTNIDFTSSATNADNIFYLTVIGNDTTYIYETNPTITFPEDAPGSYEVCQIASNLNNCLSTHCEMVLIEDIFFLYVPNSFTPNDDGINDVFLPIINNYEVDEFNLLIFNKWGQLIFESSDPNTGWNGIYNGGYAPQDVYIWKVHAVDKNDGADKVSSGHVNLLR